MDGKLGKKELEDLGLDSEGRLKLYLDPYVEEVLNEHPDWTDVQVARQARILLRRDMAKAKWKVTKEAREAEKASRDAEAKAVHVLATLLEARLGDPVSLLATCARGESVGDIIESAVSETLEQLNPSARAS